MACKRSAVRSRLAPPNSYPGEFGTSRHCGAIAQLGERLHGMQEVSGSIPLSSTKFKTLAEKRGFFYASVKPFPMTRCKKVPFLY